MGDGPGGDERRVLFRLFNGEKIGWHFLVYCAKRLLRSEWCSWRDVSVCLVFVRIFRDFYRRDMPIRRMLLSTETLTKIFHRPISVLKSNPRKVRLAITASLELTQNRDLFLELFLDFLWKSSLQQATLENQLGIESLSCVIACWSRDNY